MATPLLDEQTASVVGMVLLLVCVSTIIWVAEAVWRDVKAAQTNRPQAGANRMDDLLKPIAVLLNTAFVLVLAVMLANSDSASQAIGQDAGQILFVLISFAAPITALAQMLRRKS